MTVTAMTSSEFGARVIALDGPGGSGKSTVARLVAEASGLPYLDTGAMYRAITFGVLSRQTDPTDWPAIDAILPEITLDFADDRVSVDGVDATNAIRGPEVTENVSAVSANPVVRTLLVALQRAWLADKGGGVLEGRDIGTVVVPEAGLKVFLTASTRERAQRRALQSGGDVEEIEADLIRRDTADSERATSPLRAADDALHVDTTGLSISEVVTTIVELARERGLL